MIETWNVAHFTSEKIVNIMTLVSWSHMNLPHSTFFDAAAATATVPVPRPLPCSGKSRLWFTTSILVFILLFKRNLPKFEFKFIYLTSKIHEHNRAIKKLLDTRLNCVRCRVAGLKKGNATPKEVLKKVEKRERIRLLTVHSQPP